ncbi:NAD(P)-binding protein [Thozetella sp. PMI_491]|nr:NAD(P)-binding protein [Thozetella sp. PMI_491]
MVFQFPSLTKAWHSQPYASISPHRPELTAKNKVVVVTGGGSGIGAAIAMAFAAAGSTKIAILGRTEKKLFGTKDAIQTAFPGTTVLTLSADVTSENQISEAVNNIAAEFGKIDVFIYNSGYMATSTSVLAADMQDWWTSFQTNVLGAFYSVRAFYRFAAQDASLIHISSGMVHTPPLNTGLSSYVSSKSAATTLFKFIAVENPGLHVVSVQPGIVDTEMTRKSTGGNMDHADLPGHFVLWLVSPEAKFLRGKFVWANWDVDELKARKEEILSTDLLDFKLGGLSFVGWDSS